MKKENCEHWWGYRHYFGKWEIEEQGNLMNHSYNPPARQGFWIKQKRVCQSCGFIEIDYKELI